MVEFVGGRFRKISRTPAFMEVLKEADIQQFKRKSNSQYRFQKNFERVSRIVWKNGILRLYKRFKFTKNEVPSHEEIVEESKIICRDYIISRVKKSGFMLSPKLPQGSLYVNDTTDHIIMIGSELERLYPDLYRNISRQLNMTMSSEEVIKKIYFGVGDHMMKTEIHWGKIVAFLAFSAGLAIDCIQQGHYEFVHRIVDHFATFTSKKLVDWIARQGGWKDIINCFKGTNDHSVLWAMSGFGAMIGFLITLLLTMQI